MEVLEILANFGFPVFSFIACGYALKYEYDHSIEQISRLTEAVSQNTITLTKLVDKMEEKEN